MATITDCTISGNTSSGNGGGISDEDTRGTLILTDSTVMENTSASLGGGLICRGTSTLTDDTIVNNSGGGGVNNDGKATVVACTISGNTTAFPPGGGLYNGGLGVNVVVLDDTIIAGNFSTQSGSSLASDIDNNGVSLSGSYNLVGVGGSGGLLNGSAQETSF